MFCEENIAEGYLRRISDRKMERNVNILSLKRLKEGITIIGEDFRGKKGGFYR